LNIQLGKARLPLLLASLLPSPGRAQCPSDDWTIYSATEEVVEVAVVGREAWVAAVGGVIHIDLDTIRNQRPSQFRLTEAEGLVSLDVTCLTIDGFGNVWVGTRENGVSVFDASGNHIRNLSSFDTLVWSDKIVAAAAQGQIETCTIDFGNGPESVSCDRVVISSADTYNPSNGLPEGGGLKVVHVVRRGDQWVFAEPREFQGGVGIPRTQDILTEADEIWAGTGGDGLWRRDEATGDRMQVLSLSNGLLSNNVKKLVRAPAAGQPGTNELWVGTGAGLHTWDGAALDTIPQFTGRNILDLHRTGQQMFVLAANPADPQIISDLYRIDLSLPLDTVRVARSNCAGDTVYSGREVAVADDGRIVLGTRAHSFFVRDGFDWICPPPLGPHWPHIADLCLGLDGALYFGTGDQDVQSVPNGVGVYDFVDWSALTTGNSNLLAPNVTEVEAWPDSTMWFGTRVSAAVGGVNHYFPSTGTMNQFHPAAPEGRRTLGRNVWSMAKDAQQNLWVCYGQDGGGLSVIEWPSLQVTNFPFSVLFPSATTSLRDISHDSFGRAWVTTQSSGTIIGKLYVVDPQGTIADQTDDILTEFNVANEVGQLGETRAVLVDPSNQVWLAGNLGLVVGRITDNGNGPAFAEWRQIRPTSTQLGGRNPLPYNVSVLDGDANIWLGTNSSGVVRVSPDRVVWTWFDQADGCPLPDQSVTGLHFDERRQSMWIGTGSGGIARVGLSASGAATEATIEAYPNPWRPGQGTFVTFAGIPPDETTTLRIFNAAGELVLEMPEVRGEKTWDGRNLRNAPVESGVYLVTAKSTDGTRGTYEGKVAIIR
jgi:ligand-binding sensor domain-containing protein